MWIQNSQLVFMKKGNKNLMLKFRLTEEELELFKEKAAKFNSISSMIRTAVIGLDDGASKSKIELLNEFSNLLHQYDVQFSHVTGNLNQTVKRANQLALSHNLQFSFFEEILYPQIVNINKHIIDIKKLQKSIFKQLLNLPM